MKISPTDKLFVDDLDGEWTLAIDRAGEGTESLCCFVEDDDWLYPEELRHDNVVNVFRDVKDSEWQFNIYDLPDNWREIVTNDGGKDGKKSILDIMVERMGE